MKKNKNKENDNFISKIMNKFKKKKKKKINYTMSETIIIMIIVFGLGLIIGGIVMYGRGSFRGNTQSLNEFISTYDEIVDSYYQEVDKDKLLEAGISGMIRYLGDPYSTYMSKEAAEDFSEDIEGTYQGIGAEIKYNDDNLPTIGRVFENSPAEKAGLKENDVILKVNDTDVTKKKLSEIANIVKGEQGTSVNIVIKREKEEIPVTITRDVVDSISVTSELIEKKDKKIGYVYISSFANNTHSQLKKALDKLESDGMESLIIDVRGNSGGYLSTAHDIISMFIPKGETIYQLKTKDKIEVFYDETDEKKDYPIVVLADRNSASASELFVAALNEIYGAEIVGTKTFGKGKVQKVATLSSGAMYKYTYQEWLTPKGDYIDGNGIKPTIEIEYNPGKKNEDNQKEKAIEVILSK